MKPRDLTLWLSGLTGPIVWFLTLEANFALAPISDAPQVRLALHLITLIALVLTVAAAWVSWSGWSNAEKDGPKSRKALSLSGAAMNALFAVVIIAQSIPNFMMSARE